FGFEKSGFNSNLELSAPGAIPPKSGTQTSNHFDDTSTLYTKIGLIISFLLSIALALLIPSVIKIWYTIGTVIIPGLLVPLMASYFDKLRITARYAFPAMLFGWLISLGWLIAGNVNGNSGNYPLGIEPMYPGLAVSVLIWGVGRFRMANRGV
ncbi:MAG TPA: hypothetical protein VGR15_05575, partial [Bacteroidota bacterium]|nr:hypothetical protein [Bacteroidota bacterium]